MSDYYTESQMQRIEQAAYDGAMLEAGKEWERQRGEFGQRKPNFNLALQSLRGSSTSLLRLESYWLSIAIMRLAR